tara:strand:- start:9081 stop:10628 length:1548 start_codon:yes stop_codon:yes gene_type:complete
MAKKQTTKPMSLFDPSAMSAGFKMAYGAEMANVPVSNAASVQSMVTTQKNMMDQNVLRFKEILDKNKKEEEEKSANIKEKYSAFTDGTFSPQEATEYIKFLDGLMAEYDDNDLGKKGNEKKEAVWNQKYNRFLNGAKKNRETLTSIALMVKNDQHVDGSITKKNQNALIAIADLHGGTETNDLKATQEVKQDGSVIYKIQDGNENYEITEADLAKLVPIKDHKTSTELESIIGGISIDSAGVDKSITDDTYLNGVNLSNKIGEVIKNAENSQHAYATAITGKYGNMKQSFLEALRDPTSPSFAVILETLKSTGFVVDEFDKRIGEEINGNYTYAADGELTPEDFSKKADPSGQNLTNFIDAIKNDSKSGTPLLQAFMSSEVANNEFEHGKNQRKLAKGNQYKETAAVRNARVTTFNLSQATPPPIVTINNNQYKRVRYDATKHGVYDDMASGKDFIYTITYSNGEQRFYTPFDLSNLYEGNEFNSKMTQTTMGGFAIAPPKEEVPKKKGFFNWGG